jgi:hypothetical protein
MKIIKINTELQLSGGINVPSGAVVKLLEIYLPIDKGMMQLSIETYLNQTSLEDEEALPIKNTEYPTTILFDHVQAVMHEKPAIEASIDVLFDYFNARYPGDVVEIVEID